MLKLPRTLGDVIAMEQNRDPRVDELVQWSDEKFLRDTCDGLVLATRWDKTPEGKEYWAEVCRRLQDILQATKGEPGALKDNFMEADYGTEV